MRSSNTYDHDRQVWIADSNVNGVVVRGQEFASTQELHAFEDGVIVQAQAGGAR